MGNATQSTLAFPDYPFLPSLAGPSRSPQDLLTCGEHHSAEGTVEGPHVRGLACKHVMKAEEDDMQESEHVHPAEVEGGESPPGTISKGFDDS